MTSSRKCGIGIYAPAGYAQDPASLTRAVARLEAMGHRVIVDASCHGRWQRFSAPDDERLAAVLRMAADSRVELAVTLRGGYGWTRLLPRLDFNAVANAGKRWMGYSDFTAFQLGALAQTGMTTFAGPVATGDFGAEVPSTFTLDHCFGLLDATTYAVACTLDGADGFATEGTLWGGNLALVAHLVGTPWMPEVADGILFLEDVGEHPYRIERMLTQLHYAGVLGRQKAIVLGQFTNWQPFAHDKGYKLQTVVEWLRQAAGVPVFTGLPFGHVRTKVCLPVGAKVNLLVEGRDAFLLWGHLHTTRGHVH